jgi:prepilin-type processing-associated H-X9-DG protein/prepilin-type N-terminal cleavage/methylation domain-containing protein
MKNPGIKEKQGFGLVELLVVIGIVAVMMALLFPSVIKMKERALNVKCIQNLKNIGASLSVYLAEHGCYPGANTESGLTWYEALNDYMKDSRVSDASMISDAFRCPARGYSDGAIVGYAYNYVGFGYDKTAIGGELPPEVWFARLYWKLRPASVENPAKKLVIGDSFEQGAGGGPSAMFFYQNSSLQATRHNGGGNYLWADGHVENITPDDLWARAQSPEETPYLPFWP